MKFLKLLLIVLLCIAALLLIVPVFLPSEVSVSTQTEISLPPELIFQNVAKYTDRAKWDPWLSMEPGAKVTIVPRENFVGSTYEWEGDKIGNGKMQVDSVHYPNYIRSNIWFGDNPEPSVVEWELKQAGSGSEVTWQFTGEGSYPFGRLMMTFMKGSMRSAFETGLTNLKKYLDENPPAMYKLSKIGIEKSYATNAMVLPVEGTMEEIAQLMATGFPKLMEEISKQGLGVNGPPFAHYLDYDAESGFSHALLCFPVNNKGKAAGEIKPRYYEEIEAVTAMHFGKYDYFKESYDALTGYIAENNIEVNGEAFEVYLTSMMESSNPMDWKTMIAFPIKK